MPWDGYRLDDVVEFVPVGADRPIQAMGMFVVYAESKHNADITARSHLCWMLRMSGLLELERSESPDDLAE